MEVIKKINSHGLCIMCYIICIAAVIRGNEETDIEILITGAVGTLISILLTGFCIWFFNSTAAGARMEKDFKSGLHGLDREITITAEDGREIYHYSGKCDIETQDKYILFEDENGKRQTIYWGALDTIIIQEK